MCQGECLKLIESYPGIRSSEIAIILKISLSSICDSLCKLNTQGYVERIRIPSLFNERNSEFIYFPVIRE